MLFLSSRKLRFEKVSFYPDGALGKRFGSCFKVEKQHLKLFKPTSRDVTEGKEFGIDNRTLHDDGKAQELTEDDVKAMRGSGMSGQGIISSMIEHSSSFKDKTKYSQEKYIKKKEKKYLPVFRIVRTTTQLLCDMYFTQTPTKTYYLRKDALAQILTMSNVHANTNMMVMETCQGFVTGAMLERMGGYGKLVQIFYGDFPVRVILDNFGHLSASDKSILMAYPVRRAGSLLTGEEARTVSSLSQRMLVNSKQEAVMTTPKQSNLTEATEEGCATEEGSPPRCSSKECEEPPLKRAKLDTGKGSMEAPMEGSKEEAVMEVGEEGGGKGGDQSVSGDTSRTSCEEGRGGEVDDECSKVHSQEEHSSSERGRNGGNCGGKDSTVEERGGKDRPGDGDGEALKEDGSEPIEEEEATDSVEDKKLDSNQDSVKKKDKKTLREEGYKMSGELLSQRKMDGLVIVCRHHPEPILMTLINFLAPSRPFVVYCHLLEPLVQCYKSLKDSNAVFGIQISETWMRHYQVLEERTHPEMVMEGQSGYILTGTTIVKY